LSGGALIGTGLKLENIFKNLRGKNREIDAPTVLPIMDSTENTSVIDLIGNLKTLQTAQQLGDYLGMSPKTLFGWSKQGRIPHIKMGSALRFDPKAIAAWLRTRSV
jgi:excisionase family DNA binding protein